MFLFSHPKYASAAVLQDALTLQLVRQALSQLASSPTHFCMQPIMFIGSAMQSCEHLFTAIEQL